MFSTGEFSRVARVSKRLLQFYDEVGLLRPAFTDPRTGYRRYRAKQLHELNRILALKEVGLSLDEIRQVVDRQISQDEVKAMLELKRIELERTVASGLRRLRLLEARLNDQEGFDSDVVIKSMPSATYLGRVTQLKSAAMAWDWLRQTSAELLRAVPRKHVECFYASIPGEGFENEDFTLEAGLRLSCSPSGEMAGDEGFAMRHIPEREMVATAIQSGGPEMLYRGCGAIGRWMESQGFQLLGPPREVFTELPLPARCEDAVIETQFDLQLCPAVSN